MFSMIGKSLATVAALAVLSPLAAEAAPVAHRTVEMDGSTYRLTLAAPTAIKAERPVQVAGRGYNPAQGIFVALCAIPSTVDPRDPATYTARPTPCLGTKGSDNTSHRIVNGATGEHTSPYGPGGSFRVSLTLRPELADGVVCDVDVRCALVTRADFTATADRRSDLYIPVRFKG